MKALVFGQRSNPHLHLGNQPDTAFRTQNHFPDIRTGAGGRYGGQVKGAFQGFDPAPGKELFNAAIAQGLLATGSGGHPAADGGKLERLREMPQCVAMGPELGLNEWPGCSRTKRRDLAVRVQVDQAIHPAHVHSQYWLAFIHRIYVPGHTGAATVGNQVNVLFRGPGEQGLNLFAGGRVGHAIGEHTKLAAAHGQPVRKTLAAGMAHSRFRACIDQ